MSIINKYFKIIYKIIPDQSKKRITELVVLSLFSVILEIAGITLIIPLIYLIADKSFLASKIPFDIASTEYFPILLLIFIIFMYILKNILLIWILKKRTKISFGIGIGLSSKIYEILLCKKYSFFSGKDTSVFIRNLIQDVNAFVSNIILPIISISLELVIVFFVSIILFITEPVFFLIVLSVGSLVGIIYFKFLKKKISIIGKILLETSFKRIKLSRQVFDGIKDIIINQNQNKFQYFFFEQTKNFYRAANDKLILSSLPRYLIETIFVSAFGIFLLLMVFRGDEIKDIFLVIGIYSAIAFRLMPTFVKIYSELTSLKISLPILKDLEKIISSENKDENFRTNNRKDLSIFKLKNKITFKDVEFSYPDSDKKILININFEIKRGEKIGIIGESGSGKTTFVDLLTGLLDPTKGLIKIDDLNLSNIKHNWFNAIGYMSQKSFVIDGTIRQNILFGNSKISDEEIKKILRLVQFIEFDLDKHVDENGTNFSGGQLQRLVLARTLIKKPEVLILDECTSALDTDNEKKLLTNLINADFLKTLIIISHRKDSLSFCDKIILVKNGNLEKNEK